MSLHLLPRVVCLAQDSSSSGVLRGGQDLRKSLLPPPALPQHPGHWLTVGPPGSLGGPLLIWQTFPNICSQLNQEPETVGDGTQAGRHGAGSWGAGFVGEVMCEPHRDTLKAGNGDLGVHDMGSLMGEARTQKGGPTGLSSPALQPGRPTLWGPPFLLPAPCLHCHLQGRRTHTAGLSKRCLALTWTVLLFEQQTDPRMLGFSPWYRGGN